MLVGWLVGVQKAAKTIQTNLCSSSCCHESLATGVDSPIEELIAKTSAFWLLESKVECFFPRKVNMTQSNCHKSNLVTVKTTKTMVHWSDAQEGSQEVIHRYWSVRLNRENLNKLFNTINLWAFKYQEEEVICCGFLYLFAFLFYLLPIDLFDRHSGNLLLPSSRSEIGKVLVSVIEWFRRLCDLDEPQPHLIRVHLYVRVAF